MGSIMDRTRPWEEDEEYDFRDIIGNAKRHKERMFGDMIRSLRVAKEPKPENLFDFGFSTEEEILSNVPVDNRAETLYNMIVPFLNNLKGNPDMDVIKWDGEKRIQQINSFIDRLNAVIQGNTNVT